MAPDRVDRGCRLIEGVYVCPVEPVFETGGVRVVEAGRQQRLRGNVHALQRPVDLVEVAANIGDVDIVLTEGYKRAGKPQVEVVRAARSETPICEPGNLVALVSDVALELGVPLFGLEEAAGLADLLEEQFLQRSGDEKS